MPTYHVIPHTHWDREWYLSFDAFRVRLVHMMDDLLDILRDRDDYHGFLLDGQTIIIDDYLEIRPERHAEIAELVRANRLATGPWYVLPDTFLVSGEALVRNLLRGRSRARKLGGSVGVGYIPDSFGHTAQIPQILRGFRMDSAVVWRGFGGEPGQESSEYRWRGPDGSEVLMEHLSQLGYSGAYFADPDEGRINEQFMEVRDRLDPRARTRARLVLSGGDHHWPVRHLPDVIEVLDEAQEGSAHVLHSTLDDFFQALKSEIEGDELPVVEGELRFGYRWAFNVTGGVYSTRMYLKQANARCQRLLERYLEPLNVLAMAAGGPSQRALIDHGWTYLLQNHPHDSICGCSIDVVHREMMTRYEKLTELGRGVESFAWMRLAPGPEGIAGDVRTLTFFNPSPFVRSEIVECEVEFFRQNVVVGLNPDVNPGPKEETVDGFVLVDSDGETVPFEIVDREEGYDLSSTRYGYPSQSLVDRFTLRISLSSLPPLGLKSLRVERRAAFESYPDEGTLTAFDRGIENAHVRVDVQEDGSFTVTDKATKMRFGPLGYFEDGGDAGDVYNYSPPIRDRIRRSLDAPTVTVESVGGRYRQGVRVIAQWRVPIGLTSDRHDRSNEERALQIETTAWLTPADRHVTFETTIDNTAQDHRLRVVFETGRRTNRHQADSAFAVIDREQTAHDPTDYSIEVPAAVAPMHRFVIVEDDSACAVVLADGLPEYELKHDSDGELALTLLRCVGWLSQDALLMRPGGRSAWHNETPEAQCAGRHHYRYAFLPLSRGWHEHMPIINAAAEALLHPVRWYAGKGAERLRKDYSALRIDPKTLVLSAFKECEDGAGTLLRIYNPIDATVEGTVHFGDELRELRRADMEETAGEVLARGVRTFSDTWEPYAIQTYRYSAYPATKTAQ